MLTKNYLTGIWSLWNTSNDTHIDIDPGDFSLVAEMLRDGDPFCDECQRDYDECVCPEVDR